MGIYDSTIFETDGGLALRLPAGIGFAPDTRVTVERVGDVLTIRLAPSIADAKLALADAIMREDRDILRVLAQ